MKYLSYEHEYSLSPREEPRGAPFLRESSHACDEDFRTSTGAMVNLSPNELLVWDPRKGFILPPFVPYQSQKEFSDE